MQSSTRSHLLVLLFNSTFSFPAFLSRLFYNLSLLHALCRPFLYFTIQEIITAGLSFFNSHVSIVFSYNCMHCLYKILYSSFEINAFVNPFVCSFIHFYSFGAWWIELAYLCSTQAQFLIAVQFLFSLSPSSPVSCFPHVSCRPFFSLRHNKFVLFLTIAIHSFVI